MLTPLTLALGEQLPEIVEKLRWRLFDPFERRIRDAIDEIEKTIEQREIGCILVEPVQGRGGCL